MLIKNKKSIERNQSLFRKVMQIKKKEKRKLIKKIPKLMIGKIPKMKIKNIKKKNWITINN